MVIGGARGVMVIVEGVQILDDTDCWFGLASLFNGILTFVGYIMPKLFSYKNSSGTI